MKAAYTILLVKPPAEAKPLLQLPEDYPAVESLLTVSSLSEYTSALDEHHPRLVIYENAPDLSAEKAAALAKNSSPSPAFLVVRCPEAGNSELKYRTAEENSPGGMVDLLDRITDGFIAVDKGFRYTYVNQTAGQLIHKDPGELIGRVVWDVFPDAVNSSTFRAMNVALNEQRFISNIDYYAPLELWQENHIYPSPEGLSMFIKDITERKKLERELFEQERKQQLQIAVTAMEAQERERTYIGQELHDNVNQIITATKLVMSILRDNPDRFNEIINICISNLEKAIMENRKLAHELVRPDFKHVELVKEIERLIQTMFQAKGIAFSLLAGSFNESLLNEVQKLAIYRITQEQFTNIVKYSRSTHVKITLSTDGERFNMEIEDNGQGMDVNKAVKGIGLRNMEGRLKIHNGTMRITTSPGAGFRLEVFLPVMKHAV